MNKTLRSLVLGGVILLGLAGLVLALPYIVPVEAYRGRIETVAATATGRAFKIEGPVRLTVLPHLGLKAQQVTLANTPGGKASVMLAVGDIDLSLQLLPLFKGQIALDKIILTQPTIALEVDPDGNPNWKFGKESAHPAAKKGTLTLPPGTAFNGIEVTDGRVTYDNAKTHTHRAIEHVNLKVDITTIDQPVRLTGDLAIEGRKITFEGQLATLKTFLGSGTTGFGIAVDSELMKADFNGQMRPDGTTDGRFQLTSPSLRDLSGWLGQKLPRGGLGALALSSRILNKDKVTAFENLKVSLDHQNMTGALSIDASRTIPFLSGTLTADRLDFDPYLKGGAAQTSAAKRQPGWSRDDISFTLLKEFDGKLTFSTGSLSAQGLHLGATRLHLDVDKGVLHAVLDQISLYGGGGQAEATVDTRGRQPVFANRVSLHGVSLRPLLKDTMHLDTIEGTGAVTLDLRFTGDSADAIMHSLWGKGSLTATDGRLRGVDLGQVAKTVSVLLGGGATSDGAITAFQEMGATFTLSRGVLSTSDFHLAGPVVQMAGQGGIDIGNRTIDFHLRPGAALAGFSVAVPFRITGTWDKLHYNADVAAMVGGAMTNIQNGASALAGLFGPKKGEKQGEKKNDKKKSVGDSLKDMFGVH